MEEGYQKSSKRDPQFSSSQVFRPLPRFTESCRYPFKGFGSIELYQKLFKGKWSEMVCRDTEQCLVELTDRERRCHDELLLQVNGNFKSSLLQINSRQLPSYTMESSQNLLN